MKRRGAGATRSSGSCLGASGTRSASRHCSCRPCRDPRAAAHGAAPLRVGVASRGGSRRRELARRGRWRARLQSACCASSSRSRAAASAPSARSRSCVRACAFIDASTGGGGAARCCSAAAAAPRGGAAGHLVRGQRGPHSREARNMAKEPLREAPDEY